MWGQLAYDAFHKADAPLLTGTTGNYVTHYGGVIWWQVNTETSIYSVIPKERWGGPNQEDGWRLTTAFPSTKGYGVAQNGAVPDTVKPTYALATTLPRTMVTPFDESQVSMRAADRKQGITWKKLVTDMGITHKNFLAEKLADGGATLESGVNLSIQIDRIISSYAEVNNTTNDVTAQAWSGDATAPSVYGITRSSAAGWYDSNVMHNSNTVRTLTVPLLYQLIQTVAEASGVWDSGSYVILTGYSTASAISELLQVQDRYAITEMDTSVVNGVSTYRGKQGPVKVRAFDMKPIITSKDIDDQSGGIAPIYLVNLEYLKFWMDIPTVYYETGVNQGQVLLLGYFGQKGIYQTNQELICPWFAAHGKLRDLKR
jgi:hypothetical protein